MSRSQQPELSPEVRRELLVLALHNAGRSAPLLLVAGWFVAWLGFTHGAPEVGMVAAAITAFAAGWRYRLASRHRQIELPLARIVRTERELAANSLAAGILWSTAAWGIYPALDARTATVVLVGLVGSAAVAVHFMTLVRWSYALLVLPSIGSLAMVSLVVDAVRSVPMAVLSVICAATLLRAGAEYRITAARAIQHGLEVEGVNVSLQRAKEDAEAGAIAKSQFLATMSHEIRTPMNGVLGSLELLRRSQLTEDQRRLVRTAAASGETLMAILNDVLDHSKIEAGKLALAPAPMSLHTLAASVVGLFRANAEAKGLWLRLKVDDDAPDAVIGDSQRLKQVLLNLISNAIKFTDVGSVHLLVRATAAAPGYAGALFEVHDSGVGIAAQAIERLFSPFVQLSQDASHTRRGTGLGLAISQRIVQAMGGEIEVESQPARGSIFRFALQFELDEAQPSPAVPETSSGAFDATGPMAGTVLVAEDDPVNRLIARSMLESLGLSVVEAADGLEALAKAQVHALDIVFMDCQMPHLDGYSTTRRWREREERLGLRRVPIIALTANAFDEDVQRTRDAGMDGHLSKPYTRSQLRDHVSRWL